MLARALRPLRVKLAKLALVEEERDRRSEAITAEVSASEGRLDARITELERLRSEVRRAQRENAAILRLLGGTPGREAGEGPAPP
ncbi:MAG TPA: hypothetical protein VF972_01290, partial [Actinomycetota bacterium]